jgi:hypothetical protein
MNQEKEAENNDSQPYPPYCPKTVHKSPEPYSIKA